MRCSLQSDLSESEAARLPRCGRNVVTKPARWRSVFLVLAVLIALFNTVLIHGGHDWGGDFGLYIAQANALLQGTMDEVRGLGGLCYELSDGITAPAIYPWGYPSLLAPVIAVFGENMRAMKIATYLWLLLSLPVVATLCRRRLGKAARAGMVLMLLLNPYLYGYRNHVMSEFPFLFFSLSSVLMLDRFIVKRRTFLNPLFDRAVLGVFIFLAYFVRSQGLVLLPVVALCVAVERLRRADKHRTAGTAANEVYANVPTPPTEGRQPLRWYHDVAPFVAFGLLVLLLPAAEASRSYAECADRLRPIASTPLANALYYFVVVPGNFLGSKNLLADWIGKPLFPLYHVLYAATLPFCLLSVLRHWRRDYHLLLYVGATFGLLLICPMLGGMRYILSIAPIYLFWLLDGAAIAGRFFRLRRHWRIRLDLALATALCVLFAIQLPMVELYYQRMLATTGPFTFESRAMFAFIKEHAASTDIVAFFKPHVMTYFTGRTSIAASSVTQQRARPVRWFVEYLPQRGQRDITSCQPFSFEGLDEVFNNRDFIVYKAR